MFIREHAHQWPVRLMCATFEVHPSGYYSWCRRPRRVARAEECAMVQILRREFKDSGRVSGTRVLSKVLRRENFAVGRKRVRRLMREDGMVSKRTPRRFRVQTTDSCHDHPMAPELVLRDFNPATPNEVWVCDITYIRTTGGFVYLAAVMDLFSRSIIGWHVDDEMTQQLTRTALLNAWKGRGRPTGMIIHSDRGVQYAAEGYRRFLSDVCLARQSMSRKGNCWGNAPMESFWATLKTERIDDEVFETLDDVRTVVWRYINGRYNTRRLHSTLGYVSPEQHEINYFQHNSMTKSPV